MIYIHHNNSQLMNFYLKYEKNVEICEVTDYTWINYRCYRKLSPYHKRSLQLYMQKHESIKKLREIF